MKIVMISIDRQMELNSATYTYEIISVNLSVKSIS